MSIKIKIIALFSFSFIYYGLKNGGVKGEGHLRGKSPSYKKLRNKGDVWAQIDLGLIYEVGNGIEKIMLNRSIGIKNLPNKDLLQHYIILGYIMRMA